MLTRYNYPSERILQRTSSRVQPQGNSFYDGFEFWAHPDPTGGLVNYLTLSDARSKNLTHADDGSFVIRGDATQTLSGGQGRDSVRIQSHKTCAPLYHPIPREPAERSL